MTYSTAHFNLVSFGPMTNTDQPRVWTYKTTDSLATVLGAGYVSDATKKGALAGDVVLLDISTTPTVYVLKISSITTGAATLKGVDASLDGQIIGSSSTATLGFYGTAAIVQPTSANEAAVGTTASTTTTPAGYTTTTQANSLVTLVNQLRADLVALGLIKGS